MAWVNAQLKKRPSVKPVQDLRQDLRDGVILAYLIEIVGQLALDSDASVDKNLTSPCSLQAGCLHSWRWSWEDLKYFPKVNSHTVNKHYARHCIYYMRRCWPC